MVDDSQAKTPAARRARGRAPGARRTAAGAALAARARAVRGRAGRCRAGRWRRTRRSRSPCGATSPRRSTCGRSAHLEQLETLSDPAAIPTRRELATAYLGLVPSRRRPAGPGGHALASARRAPGARVRPRGDPPQRARTAPRETLVHEPRLRPRAAALHARRAARHLRRGARPSGERDEPPARPAAAPAARGHRASVGTTGAGGGRPAAIYRFRRARLEVTDQFAVLRPPTIAQLVGRQAHT